MAQTNFLRGCRRFLRFRIGWVPWGITVFMLAANVSRAVVERVVDKRVPVTRARGALSIDTYQGTISIIPTDEAEIHVVVRQGMDVKDEAAAEVRLRDLELVFDHSDGGLAIRAYYRKTVQWTWKTWPPVTLVFELHVPRTCDLDLVTREGAITVGDLQGNVKAHTSKGAIFLHEIDGTINAESDQGDVSVTSCSQALTIAARNGNVLVGRVNGPSEVSDVNGLLELQNVRGALRARGDGADLKIGFAYPLSAAAELDTAGGDIAVSFDSRNAGAVDAHASRFGRVQVRDLPLTLTAGKVGSSHLTARLKEGGPTVTVRASGGNIRLTGFAPMP